MKKLLTLAALLSVAVFLGGCQTATDSESSSSEKDDENSMAMGEGGDGGEMGSDGMDGGCGDGMDGCCGEGMDGCCEDGMCDEDMDGECGEDGMDDSCGEDGMDDDYGEDGMDDSCGEDGMDDPDMDGDCDGDYGCGEDGEGGGGSVPKFDEGTAENAVMQTWTAVKNGEQTGLAAFISSSAKGELATLRDGKLSPERLEELKQQMTTVKFLRPKTIGRSKTISLQNVEGIIFRFTCRKENDIYLIREFTVKAPSKRNRRKSY